MSTYYVVDYGDDFVLYTGNLQDCEQVVQENYGGLQVSSYQNLSVKMKNQIEINKMLEEAYKEEDK
jgi:hypothetical protein